MVGVGEAAYEGVILGKQDRGGKVVYLIQTVEAEFAVPVAWTHCLPRIDVNGARKVLDRIPPYGPR